MAKLVALFLSVTTVALLGFLALNLRQSASEPKANLTALSQSYIVSKRGAPLRVPPLVSSDGVFGPEQLKGHWSVIFFGFTACPLVCPRTLSVLAAVAKIPESKVSSGETGLFFVSIDPDRDTPQRVRSYVKNFDSHIVGLTGSADSIKQFSDEVGAGYQLGTSVIDHSTSLFVVDPEGRLAGLLLRPSEPARVIADFARIRSSRSGL